MTHLPPLVDSFGRQHSNLRISVTDRCNIRCFYCMPDAHIRFLPREEILTFEEIVRFVRTLAPAGVNKLRLTGGEPLIRTDLPALIKQLVSIPGIDDVALTTNGILLAEQAASLKAAGLHRLNVSLDALSESTFQRISRRTGLQQILDGIFAARQAGFDRIRLNSVAISGISDAELVPLVEFAREHDFELRFIEFMPLDADQNWESVQVLTGEKIRTLLEDHFGKLVPTARPDPSQPALDYRFADGVGRLGFINPVTQPFCQDCNRLRITAEGKVRNCLFSTVEWDARQLMRSGGDDDSLLQLVRDAIAHKKIGHGIDSKDFVRPQRAMYEIGG